MYVCLVISWMDQDQLALYRPLVQRLSLNGIEMRFQSFLQYNHEFMVHEFKQHWKWKVG